MLDVDEYRNYKYQASGMFRDSRVPRGTTADVVHAEALVRLLYEEIDRLRGLYERDI